MACVPPALQLVWPFVIKVTTQKPVPEVVIFYGVQVFAFVTGKFLSSTVCSGLSSHYCGAALCGICPCVRWCGRTCAPLGTHYRIAAYCCLVSLCTRACMYLCSTEKPVNRKMLKCVHTPQIDKETRDAVCGGPF